MPYNENQKINFIAKLPPEIGLHIFSFLSRDDFVAVTQVSKDWRSFAEDQNYWMRLTDRFDQEIKEAAKEWFTANNVKFSWRRMYYKCKRYVDIELSYYLQSQDRDIHQYLGVSDWVFFRSLGRSLGFKKVSGSSLTSIQNPRVQAKVKQLVFSDLYVAHSRKEDLDRLSMAIMQCQKLEYLVIKLHRVDEIDNGLSFLLKIFQEHETLRVCSLVLPPGQLDAPIIVGEDVRRLFNQTPARKKYRIINYDRLSIELKIKSVEDLIECIPPACLVQLTLRSYAGCYVDFFSPQKKAALSSFFSFCRKNQLDSFSVLENPRKLTLYFQTRDNIYPPDFTYLPTGTFQNLCSLYTLLLVYPYNRRAHYVAGLPEDYFKEFMMLLRRNKKIRTLSIQNNLLSNEQLSQVLKYVLDGKCEIRDLGLMVSCENIEAVCDFLSSNTIPGKLIKLYLNLQNQHDGVQRLRERIIRYKVLYALIDNDFVVAINASFFDEAFLKKLIQYNRRITNLTAKFYEMILWAARLRAKVSDDFTIAQALRKNLLGTREVQEVRDDFFNINDYLYKLFLDYFSSNFFCQGSGQDRNSLLIIGKWVAAFKQEQSFYDAFNKGFDRLDDQQKMQRYALVFSCVPDEVTMKIRAKYFSPIVAAIAADMRGGDFKNAYMRFSEYFRRLRSLRSEDLRGLCATWLVELQASLKTIVNKRHVIHRIHFCYLLRDLDRKGNFFDLHMVFHFSQICCQISMPPSELMVQRDYLTERFRQFVGPAQHKLFHNPVYHFYYHELQGDLYAAARMFDEALEQYRVAEGYISADSSPEVKQHRDRLNVKINGHINERGKRSQSEYSNSKRVCMRGMGG